MIKHHPDVDTKIPVLAVLEQADVAMLLEQIKEDGCDGPLFFSVDHLHLEPPAQDSFEILFTVLKTPENIEQSSTVIRYSTFEYRLITACRKLLNAPHHDHFAARLGDEELEAVEEIKELIDALDNSPSMK